MVYDKCIPPSKSFNKSSSSSSSSGGEDFDVIFGFDGTFEFDGTLGFGSIFGFDGTSGLCGGLYSMNFSPFEVKSTSKITGKKLALCTKTL